MHRSGKRWRSTDVSGLRGRFTMTPRADPLIETKWWELDLETLWFLIVDWLVALSKTALNKQNVPYFTWIPNETDREKNEVRLHENSAQTLKYKAVLLFDRFWEGSLTWCWSHKECQTGLMTSSCGRRTAVLSIQYDRPPPSACHSFFLAFISLLAEVWYRSIFLLIKSCLL